MDALDATEECDFDAASSACAAEFLYRTIKQRVDSCHLRRAGGAPAVHQRNGVAEAVLHARQQRATFDTTLFTTDVRVVQSMRHCASSCGVALSPVTLLSTTRSRRRSWWGRSSRAIRLEHSAVCAEQRLRPAAHTGRSIRALAGARQLCTAAAAAAQLIEQALTLRVATGIGGECRDYALLLATDVHENCALAPQPLAAVQETRVPPTLHACRRRPRRQRLRAAVSFPFCTFSRQRPSTRAPGSRQLAQVPNLIALVQKESAGESVKVFHFEESAGEQH
jgi:hypothetical protein